MIKPTFYRGGVMYVVAGWVMVQVATSTFPYFNIPPWAIRFVVIAILIGFPVALVCLWMFESIDPNQPDKHLHNRRQGAREDSSTLTKMMETERAERQKQNQDLIAALAQLKTNGPEQPQGSMHAAVAATNAQILNKSKNGRRKLNTSTKAGITQSRCYMLWRFGKDATWMDET